MIAPAPPPSRTPSSLVEVADRALQDRPLFSIRMQVYLSVLLLFLIVIIIAVTTITTMTRVHQEARLSALASRLVFEIEQARRYEKNFFLHGSNLDDALENVHQARRLLRIVAGQLDEKSSRTLFEALTDHLEQYAVLLEAQADRPADRRASGEPEVRRHGRKLVSLAAELETGRQQTLDRRLRVSRALQYGLLAFLLLYIIGMTYVLVRRIASPIRRLMMHTRRIASGDHTPIMPTRRYRDEFSALAVSINEMLAKLEHRQDVLVASHKMRAVGTLTAGVAHELNNPINNITLTAHVMLENYEELDDAERQEMVQDIVKEAERTQKIVAGLLEFTRQSESQVKPIELGKVVQETVALVQNQLNLKGARANVAIAHHLPLIHGDAQQLAQVLLNLILNAIDVTERGGGIDITLARGQEGFLDVQVRDHGPGIPDHILPFIFDPFFTTKPRGKGTGLGLAICKGIVNKHGGDLTVQTKVGQGATFTLCLPITSIPMDFQAVVERKNGVAAV